MQRLKGFQHGMMLNRRGNQMPPALPVRLRRAPNGEVVAFRAARSEHDLVRPGVQTIGNGFAGLFDSLPRRHADLMQGRRIAIVRGEEWQHGFDDFGGDGRRRGVIQINGKVHRTGF